jgi:hypothetical protein
MAVNLPSTLDGNAQEVSCHNIFYSILVGSNQSCCRSLTLCFRLAPTEGSLLLCGSGHVLTRARRHESTR